MTGATPILGLPYSEPGDSMSLLPSVMEDLAEKLEAGAFTPNKPASAAHSTYPIGTSVMTITGSDATAGEWPAGVSATVMTIRRADGAGTAQFWLRNTTSAPEVRYRSGSGTTWSPWVVLGGSGLPAAMAAGEYVFPSSKDDQSHTITFPTGRFTAAPLVTVSGSTRDSVMVAYFISATGFTVGSGPIGSASAQTRRVTWQAIQMNGGA